MKMIVCVKQIPDPETPAAAFRVDERANKVIPAQGIAPVISPGRPAAATSKRSSSCWNVAHASMPLTRNGALLHCNGRGTGTSRTISRASPSATLRW